MNTKLVWFGDSYTIGQELGRHHGEWPTSKYDDRLPNLEIIDKKRGRPDLAFPILASQELGIDFLLYGAGGRAITGMYCDLLHLTKTKQDDMHHVAVFAFPSQVRRCHYIDNDGNPMNHADSNVMRHQLRFHKFETTLTINSIHNTCVANNITPYYVCTWRQLELMDDLNIVPEENWLLPYDHTLVEHAWHFRDHTGDWLEISEDNKWVFEKYIHPCMNHPNKAGQEALAESMTDLLRDRLLGVGR